MEPYELLLSISRREIEGVVLLRISPYTLSVPVVQLSKSHRKDAHFYVVLRYFMFVMLCYVMFRLTYKVNLLFSLLFSREMTLRHFVFGSRPFEVTWCLPTVGSRNFRRLKINTLTLFKTSGTDYYPVLHLHVANELNHQLHSCANLKPTLPGGACIRRLVAVRSGIASSDTRGTCRFVTCNAVNSKVCSIPAGVSAVVYLCE
jgi:hypothetical protein